MAEKCINYSLLRSLINDYITVCQILEHNKYKRRKLSGRFGYFNKSAKLEHADINCRLQQTQCDEIKKKITDLIIVDDDPEWNDDSPKAKKETAIEIVGSTLEVYYDINKAYCKNHGHYGINLSGKYIIYHRPLNKPHGPQNYLVSKNSTSK